MKETLETLLVRHKITTHKRLRRLLQTHILCINGERVFLPSSETDIKKDIITLDGKKLDFPSELYFMMNKRQGTLCSRKDTVPDDKRKYELVYDDIKKEHLFPEGLPPLHTVGRLDADTEGLLIFTTNGILSHRLADPKYHVDKTYLVTLENPVTTEEQIRYKNKSLEGIFIPNFNSEKSFTSQSAELTWITNSTCTLTIHEGKFHQVKRMFQVLGNRVTALKRISMGKLKLDENLKSGEYRELTEKEITMLTEINDF